MRGCSGGVLRFVGDLVHDGPAILLSSSDCLFRHPPVVGVLDLPDSLLNEINCNIGPSNPVFRVAVGVFRPLLGIPDDIISSPLDGFPLPLQVLLLPLLVSRVRVVPHKPLSITRSVPEVTADALHGALNVV